MTEINYKLRLNLITILLVYLITISNFIVFYFLYEIVFIFIIFTILLLGYRYERLIAGYLMLFYSFLFSRPIIIMFLIFDNVFLFKISINYTILMNYFLIASFIVKFPIFGFHYWLPVAHVEASTIGSILLAGILLKVGCIGIFYVVFYLNFIVKFHWLRISVLLTILFILWLRDLKIIIAYSSVAHIRIVFYVIITGRWIAKKSCLIMMFYHGFISPLIFWLIGLLSWWKTRSLFVVKLISFSFLFFIMIFILTIINIRFPPFLGFLSEVIILKSIILFKISLYIFIFSILFRCYYNIYFFWSFSNNFGIIMKVNLYIVDVFVFIFFVLWLNF